MAQPMMKCHLGSYNINVDNKPHHCPYCQKGFTKISVLRIHMCSHIGNKPYFCNICKKGYAAERSLKEHILSHTGEKPYICNICEKRFRTKSNCKRHIDKHVSEVPHACSECEKEFFCKAQLKRHVRLAHNLKMDEICYICNTTFKVKREYDEHILSHAPVRFYLCEICRKQFSSISNLNDHKCIPIQQITNKVAQHFE